MSVSLPGNPVRILYVDHAPILGGAEVVLLNLIGALDRDRFTPIVATAPGSPLIPKLEAAGVESAEVSFGRLNQAGLVMPVNLAHAAWAVARLARQQRVSLLHTNTVRAHIVGALAALLTGKPLIWTLHDNTLPLRVARLFAPVPARVVTVSNWLRDRYGPMGLARKTIVIHNGIDIATPIGSPKGLREELNVAPDAPLVVNVGRLVAGKAPHVFVEAARRVSDVLPNTHFVLVGGPDRLEPGQRPSAYYDDLICAVHKSDLGQRLIVTGHRSDAARFYAAADIVAYCAVLPEGLPTVLLEAMLNAKPIAAAAIGGALEIVQDGITGRLVPPGDANALAHAIVELIQNQEQARAMGRAGRARLESEFDLRTQAVKTQRLYDEVPR